MALSSVRVQVNDEDRATLLGWTRSSSVRAGLATRAKIVLAAGQGEGTSAISRRLGVSRPTVIQWRDRYAADGLAGLDDAQRSGRPKTIDDAAIIAATLEPPPDRLGVTHWSTRLLAQELRIGHATIARAWRRYRVQPWRRETFKFSTDPELEAKVRDVVGLYLNPPEKAVVLCVDEKSQIQALDRTQPGLPLKKGRCGTMTHDYKRNGTATLFAAMNTLDGSVISMCNDRHRHQEWLKFLRVIDDVTPPSKELYLIADNYATHKHPNVQRWLKRHPRFHMYFTPTSSSWLNMVERFFRDLTVQRLRRGIFRDVEELITAIGEYIDKHNDKPKPFVWTAKAADILEKVKRARAVLDNG
jgi:transposase